MTVRALLLAVALTALLPAVATAAARDDFVAAQKERARQLADDDRLAEALAIWRTLLPLGTPDDETSAAIAELERTIAARVQSLESRARQAYGAGRRSDGDTYMLKLLALEPGHPGALKRLRRSHSLFAQRQQQEKSDTEYRDTVREQRATEPPLNSTYDRLLALEQRGEYDAMLALAERAGSTDGDSARLLRGAHIALADRAERNGDLDKALEHMGAAMVLLPLADDPLLARSAELRGQLSADWYRRGTALIKTDLPGAIAALEKAVAYNPYNDNARRKLDQAQTLRRNLERIEGGL